MSTVKYYSEIVFMQGDEGHTVTDILYNTEGVVSYGISEESFDKTLAYLSDWDYGEDDNLKDEENFFQELGSNDDIVYRDNRKGEVWNHYSPYNFNSLTHGDYIITAHNGLGYIGLYRVVEEAN